MDCLDALASDRQLARDHDLVKRTHTMGILVDDSRARDEGAAAIARMLGVPASLRQRREFGQRGKQKPREPHALAFAVVADPVHAIVPVAAAEQRQAMSSELKASVERPGAVRDAVEMLIAQPPSS